MVLLTTSEGRFEDVSMHEDHVDGNDGSSSALRCGGKRVNPSLRTNKHKLIWWAPARGDGGRRDSRDDGERGVERALSGDVYGARERRFAAAERERGERVGRRAGAR